MKISINLSPGQFNDPTLVAHIQETLSDVKLDASNVEFEITESLMMKDLDRAAQIIKQLRYMGVSIAIDDFGTGYSSLSKLKHLHVDTLKVDREFVFDIGINRESERITEAIINMAHTLKLNVVAEGIETEDQLAFLVKSGCEVGQDYHFSPPVPATELKCLLDGSQSSREVREDNSKNTALCS